MRRAAFADVFADRPDEFQGSSDVKPGTWQQAAQLAARQLLSAQVDAAQGYGLRGMPAVR